MGDQRAQLAEGAARHLLQAVELPGDARRIALQQQAGRVAGVGDAKDRLAHRVVQLACQAVTLAHCRQFFGLGRKFLKSVVG